MTVVIFDLCLRCLVPTRICCCFVIGIAVAVAVVAILAVFVAFIGTSILRFCALLV